MNVNMNTEVKGYGAPAPPSVEQSSRDSGIRPVEPGNSAGKASTEERQLKDRKAEERTVSEKELAQAAEDLQARLDQMSTNLQFSVDEKTESIVIQVTHRDSGDVVRQIPSEEILDLKAKLEKLVGVLFDKEV